MIIHKAKIAITEEYKAKERAREVEARIARSTAIGDARVKKMRVRDELLGKLVAQAKAEVAKVVDTPAYPELIKKLIVNRSAVPSPGRRGGTAARQRLCVAAAEARERGLGTRRGALGGTLLRASRRVATPPRPQAPSTRGAAATASADSP